MQRNPMEKLLELKDLTVSFKNNGQKITVVRQVSLAVEKGEILGLVGESGSGKSVTAKSILGLLNASGKTRVSGKIFLNGKDLLGEKSGQGEKLRSRKLAMIFQDPVDSLNPVFTVGYQIAEVFMAHEKMSKKPAWKKSIEMLKRVEIPSPEWTAKQYPHQLSGGMCQRVMIAMALAGTPELLVADEPTTALDVTIQAQIMRLLYDFNEKTGAAILFITHDLGLVAQFCHSVAIMLHGEIIEKGRVEDIFMNPLHPYTRGLLNSIPVPGKKERLRPMVEDLGMDPCSGGCRFFNRCSRKTNRCEWETPNFLEPIPHHFVQCFNMEQG